MRARLRHTAKPALNTNESPAFPVPCARAARWPAGAKAGEGAAGLPRAHGRTSLGEVPLAPLAWRPGAQMVSA